MKALVVLCMLTALPGFAKSNYAPLPPEAYAAKTIAIVNHTNTQTVTDRAYQELQKWGRLEVVQDPTVADMLLVIDVDRQVVGAGAHTTLSNYGNMTTANTSVREHAVLHVTTSFILKGQTVSFFTETENAALFRKSATKRCVDELKKRLDQVPR